MQEVLEALAYMHGKGIMHRAAASVRAAHKGYKDMA